MTTASITDEVERMLDGLGGAEVTEVSGGVNYVVTNEEKGHFGSGAYC